ncbi:MAG TPA: hypothetical protein VF544_18455 [Pyrinomonadaceae bacterium]
MVQNIDKILLPFLQAHNETDSENLLARLVYEYADPVIKGILKRKLGVSLMPADLSYDNQDALEIASDIQALLLIHLNRLKRQPATISINNFRGYVAIKTYSAYNAYLRRKHPERWRLKNRLRYLFSHQPAFALWENAEGEWLCGLASWHYGAREALSARPRGQLRDYLLSSEKRRLIADCSEGSEPTRALLTVFNVVGSPVEFDELVNVIAEMWGIREPTESTALGEEETGEIYEALADPRASVALVLDRRLYLQRLWSEILRLPPRQRAALLLNLRDEQGAGVLALLPLIEIASLGEIAQALDMPEGQMAKLWYDLPLDDAVIAKMLGGTRQQVINLRKAARARLRRRMETFD